MEAIHSSEISVNFLWPAWHRILGSHQCESLRPNRTLPVSHISAVQEVYNTECRKRSCVFSFLDYVLIFQCKLCLNPQRQCRTHWKKQTVNSEEDKSGTVFTSRSEDSEHNGTSNGDIKPHWQWGLLGTVLIPLNFKVHHVHDRDMAFLGTTFTVFVTVTTFSMIRSPAIFCNPIKDVKNCGRFAHFARLSRQSQLSDRRTGVRWSDKQRGEIIDRVSQKQNLNQWNLPQNPALNRVFSPRRRQGYEYRKWEGK
jgi:hypothetical protein